MNVLRLNLYFKLPENFQGSLTEALEEYIKYRKTTTDKTSHIDEVIAYEDLFPEKDSELFDSFLLAVEDGSKVKGTYAILGYDTINSEWKGFHTDNKEGE